MQFAIPKGMSLFNFIGGSRYFHGGRSLQEVIVPVITVEQIRGKEKERTRDKCVGTGAWAGAPYYYREASF